MHGHTRHATKQETETTARREPTRAVGGRRRRTARQRVAWLLLALLTAGAAPGCLSVLSNGEITHFAVDEQGALRGAWHGADDRDRAIPRDDGDAATRDDAFQLSFDTAFLKYLPDTGGLNEVIIVFRFRDGPGTEEENEVVKILGPLRRQPDGSLLPAISRVSYGPTTLESEYLAVNIQVVEYDREESDDTSAFIDFVGNAAETLSIADPVTTAEIKLAKEIAKVVAAANQNDVIIDACFDLVPFDEEVWKRHPDARPAALPLRTGTFGLIKQEIPSPLATFFPATRSLTFEGSWNEKLGDGLVTLLTVPVDLVHLPFAGFERTFNDTPDRASMVPLGRQGGRLRDGDHELAFDHDSRLLTLDGAKAAKNAKAGKDAAERAVELYRAKSWLVFSVSAGHRPLPRDAVRHLTAGEQKIVERLGRRSLAEVLDESLIDEAIADLQKAKAATREAREASGYAIVGPTVRELAAGGQTDLHVELRHPAGAVIQPALEAVELASGVTAPPITTTHTADTRRAGVWRFTAGGAAPQHVPGEFRVAFLHDADGRAPSRINLPITLIKKLVLTAGSWPTTGSEWKPGNSLQVATLAGDPGHVQRVRLEYTVGGEPREVVFQPDEAGVVLDASGLTLPHPGSDDIDGITRLVLERDGGLPDVSLP